MMTKKIREKLKGESGSTIQSSTSHSSSKRHDGIDGIDGIDGSMASDTYMSSGTIGNSSSGRLEIGKTKPKPPPVRPSNFYEFYGSQRRKL